MAVDWKQFLQGTPARFEQVSTFSEPQKAAMNQVLGYALPQVTSNKFDFEPIAEYARKNFNERYLPSLQERFVGAGRSSGYRNAITGAAADLEANLAAQRQGYNLQQQSQLQNLLGIGLTPQFETAHFAAEPGFAQAVAPELGKGAASVVSKAGELGVDALRAVGKRIGNKIFGDSEQQQENQPSQSTQPSTGVQAVKAAAEGVASGVAPVAASAAGGKAAAALAPAAAKAIGGLTPFGAWALPIAAGIALTVGGYFAYNALKKKWEKQRDLNPEEQRLAQQLNGATAEQLAKAGVIPLPSNYAQQKALGYIR